MAKFLGIEKNHKHQQTKTFPYNPHHNKTPSLQTPTLTLMKIKIVLNKNSYPTIMIHLLFILA